jgi:hypothetical protein
MPTNTGLQIASLQEAITDENTRDRSYNSLWHTYWDQDGVADGPFNARMLNWINTVLGESYTDLPGAMQAFAESRGFYNWDSITDLELAYFASVLFANGEDGAWYDIADTTSMRVGRDGSGGVPGVGDPVGFVMDKRKMGRKTAAQFIASQPELATNGGFDTTDDWLVGAGWSIANGVASRVSSSGLGNLALANLGTIEGDYYQLTFEITVTAGSLGLSLAGTSLGAINTTGAYTFIAKAGASANSIVFVGADAAVDLEIDNVSFKHIPGNHLFAPSDAARPVYQTEVVEGTAVDVSSSPELVTNGGFDSDVSGWTESENTSTAIVANGVEISNTTTYPSSIKQTLATEADRKYLVSFNRTNGGDSASTRVTLNAGTTSAYTGSLYSSPSVTTSAFSFIFLATSSQSTLTFYTNSSLATSTTIIDNVSVREVPASAARRHKLVFDGADDILVCQNAWMAAGDHSVVAAVAATTGIDDYIVAEGSTSNSNPILSPIRSDVSDVDRLVSYYRGDGGGAEVWVAVADFGANTLLGGTPRVISVTLDGTAFDVNADNSEILSQSVTPETTTTDRFSIGGLQRASASNFTECDVYGVVSIDRALTAEERDNVETLLATRSGATLA